MTKLKLFHLKNEMLLANCFANFIGVFLVNVVISKNQDALPKGFFDHPMVFWTETLFGPFAFLFVSAITVLYEKPIRKYLDALFRLTNIPQDLEVRARRRLLNEPFVLISLDLSMWLLAAVVWTFIHWLYASGAPLFQQVMCSNLSTGLITVTVAFFLLEHLLQKRMAPFFFPNGGLSGMPRTLRIRIRTRLVALLFACNLIPLLSIILIAVRFADSQNDPALAITQLNSAIFLNAMIFIGVGICLTILVSRNLSIPFRDIIETLARIKNGRFDKRVRVVSNDEIGFTGDAINEMAKGLIERDQMQQELNLAKEVQQNLLPKSNLRVNGFDIAGKSIYCDETGGDYYDFIDTCGGKKTGVAIGDVSGHGIQSALLMATVRSSLRQRLSLPGTISSIITDVNRQLVTDVEESGQFMTLFFMTLDTELKNIEWVRAGHDPAILYDPGTNTFDELGGSGIALGLDAVWPYEYQKKTEISDGQIIFLSTDGVWEVQNSKGEMMGKEPILNAIRDKASHPASQILDAVFDSLTKFRGKARIEDDVTAVVIKIDG